MTAEPLLLGVDLGTSSLKCALFDEAGHCAASARVAYPTYVCDGGAEQHCDDWWTALSTGIHQVVAEVGQSRIGAIGVGGHAPSPVFVDSDLQPVAAVLPWFDNRSAYERDDLLSHFGRQVASGPERLMVQLAARAMWLRNRATRDFSRAAGVLQSGDYLIARLTGQRVMTSPILRDVFAAAGLPIELLPLRECRPGELVGGISAAIAKEFGLSDNLPIVAGGLDSFLASIGSGMREPGDACLNTGSSSVVAMLTRISESSRFEWGELQILSRPIRPGGRVLEAVWRYAESGTSFVQILLEALRLSPPPTLQHPMTDLIYFTDGDEHAFHEAAAPIAQRHRPAVLFRMLIDSLLSNQRTALEEFERASQPARRIWSVGGLAACPEFTQLQADVLGRTIEVPRITDSGGLGAAMVAAIGLRKCLPSETASRMVNTGRIHYPKVFNKASGELSFDRSHEISHRARHVIWKGGKEATQHESLLACGFPRFIARGDGCHIWDVDGNCYVDYLMSWGTVLLGHAYPAVEIEVARQLSRGSSLNLAIEQEVSLAELLVQIIPGVEMVRFLSTGAEATNAAVRVARAATGRDKVVCYGFHGWLDWCQSAHPAGIPSATVSNILSLEYNNLEALRQLFARHVDAIACIIMEPVKDEIPANEFLAGVRDLAHQHGALLIFDEAKTGFRFGLGGAQTHYAVMPDLSVFSKAVANGYPLSVLAGKAEVFARASDAWVSGTYHGWPPAIAAAQATLSVLACEPVVQHVWDLGQRLMEGFNDSMVRHGLDARLRGVPPMPQLCCPPSESATIQRFVAEMLRHGYFIHPVRPWFISYAHNSQYIDQTLDAVEIAVRLAVAS